MVQIRNLELEDFRRLQTESNPFVVDVRPQSNVSEVKQLLGSETDVVAIPLSDSFARHAALPKDRPIVTVCKMGVTSVKAAEKLVAAGFNDVYSLNGGVTKLASVRPA